MDYGSNGTGEDLNARALLSSSMQFRDLFRPESAAVALLNLSDDPSKVQIERVYEESGSVNLYIRFPEEAIELTMPVTMVQPYGPEGIWIPKDYTVDVVSRFRNMDWSEIRKRRLADSNDPDIWKEVVCIAEIPEESIKIYGYNDAEWSFEGVAIEIGNDVNYFDWIYTSPQCRLPECYWNQAGRQLQVALNIYTGTGLSVYMPSWQGMMGKYAALPLGQLYGLGHGDLFITAADLSRFARILAGCPQPGEPVKLTPELLRQMQTVQYEEEPTPESYTEIKRGLGTHITDQLVTNRRMVGHQGNAYGSICGMFVDPADHTGFVFLTNGAWGGKDEAGLYYVNRDIARAVYAALFTPPGESVEPAVEPSIAVTEAEDAPQALVEAEPAP